MYVCLCRGITDQDIKDAIANGAESYRDVRDMLDLGTCCGRCAPEARMIISDEVSQIAARLAVAAQIQNISPYKHNEKTMIFGHYSSPAFDSGGFLLPFI